MHGVCWDDRVVTPEIAALSDVREALSALRRY
jgi:hypothetical protein